MEHETKDITLLVEVKITRTIHDEEWWIERLQERGVSVNGLRLAAFVDEVNIYTKN